MCIRRDGWSGILLRNIAAIRNLCYETVAALGKGLDEARPTGLISEELTQLKHVGAQNLGLNVGLRPELIQEFVMSDQAAGILHEVTQNCERLGRKGHCDAVVEQALIYRVEPEGPKLLHSDRTSG
jgi:hypothetical protein